MSEVKLVRYEAARRALGEAKRVDEVKAIRDKAVAMQVYAKQAKDRDLIDRATEIRKRAERRAGELLVEMKERGERQKAGDSPRGNSSKLPPLKALGVTKTQSSRWQKQAVMSERDFERSLSEAKDHAVASLDRGQTQRDKKQRRTQREKELAKKIVALPGKRYGVIVADPEWQFQPWSRETGMDRAADNHYPTSVTKVIAARPVENIAAKDCVLFLWATVPMLPHALTVMAAWGFDYRSHFVWAKDRIGTGYWNRNKHELLLVGVRGNIPAPAPGKQWQSFIQAAVSKHSAKPDKFLRMIEEYFPTLPKIELNRRGKPRAGWEAWGNEVMQEAAE